MARHAQVETDWYTGTNPDVLLNAARPLEKVTTKTKAARDLRRSVYERRRRLFGCACARVLWDVLPTDARSAVVISERYACGKATQADVNAAAVRVILAPITFQQHAICAAGSASAAIYSRSFQIRDVIAPNPTEAARSAAKSIATRAAGPAPGGNPVAIAWQTTWNTAFAEARAYQAELVRDIFPPPGYTPTLLTDWQTSTILLLARQMDETGDFSAVPILADALEDAGCDDNVVLDRCRIESGIHCRGNWVLDLVLGRE